MSNGTLNKTIFPLTSFDRLANSSKLLTAITFAVMPLLLVPMLPPRPSIARFFDHGFTILADSSPRTHLGTITSSALTFSIPSFFISCMIQRIAFSKFSLPLNLGPKVSQSSATRSKPTESLNMASMIFFDSC